jgi:uncharacterized protein DUF3987
MPPRKLDNWLQSYLVVTNQQESPEVYHKWIALSVLAGAIRRKVFFDYEGAGFLAYPNMYIVLVGPAGRCKKSTAMRIGRKMLSQVPGVNFTTDSVTREKLIQDLSQTFRDGHSSMTAYSSEFATLLTSSGMDMVVFLTDIFDSPPDWTHSTKMSQTNTIKAPYLNLMGATTPDWMSKAMPLDTVGIGLTSRIVFVYENTPRVRSAFPVLSDSQREIRNWLVEDLISISQLAGEYKLDSHARADYEEWYQARIQNPNPTGDPRLSGYFERKPVHLIKVAMLIAASFRDQLIITQNDLKEAHLLFNEVESKMALAFANVGKNPLATDYMDILDAIAHQPGIKLADLLMKFKHNVRKEELAEVLDTLTAAGTIRAAAGPSFFPVKGAVE